MSNKRDYYEVLTVSREVSTEELRKAYRREALKHHPDRNQGDATAEAKFKEVNEAYQVLSDESKRAIYDQFGHAGLEGAGASGFEGVSDVFSHMQDLFAEMFSGGGGGGRSSFCLTSSMILVSSGPFMTSMTLRPRPLTTP